MSFTLEKLIFGRSENRNGKCVFSSKSTPSATAENNRRIASTSYQRKKFKDIINTPNHIIFTLQLTISRIKN